VLLKLTGEISRVGNWEATRQFGRGHAFRQFQQCQGISPCFGNDSIPNTGIDPSGDGCCKQSLSVVVGEAVQNQLRQPYEVAFLAGLSDTEKHQYRLGKNPSRHKPEDLAGRGIKPLGVIDDAQQRMLLREFSQQAKRRKGYEEAVGCPARR